MKSEVTAKLSLLEVRVGRVGDVLSQYEVTVTLYIYQQFAHSLGLICICML